MATSDSAVPTLRCETWIEAAGRWDDRFAKSQQNDYLQYLSRAEQLGLDLLAARRRSAKRALRSHRGGASGDCEQPALSLRRSGLRTWKSKSRRKRRRFDEADRSFNQFKDYFKGMKDSVTSMIDVAVRFGWDGLALSTSGVGEALGLGQGGGRRCGLPLVPQDQRAGSAMGGLGVVEVLRHLPF
jgi:hypothetical protein